MGVSWLLRRGKRTGKLRIGGGDLNVVATTQLGPNRAVHLIRVGPELVLVGSAEHGVVPIRVYAGADASALEAMLVEEGTISSRPVPISNLVEQLRKKTAR